MLLLKELALFAALFYAVWFMSRGQWIGFADGKVAALIGLMLGFSAGFTALAVAFWVGAAICIVLLLAKKIPFTKLELGMGDAVPFGPFMIFGLWFVFVTGLNLFQLTV